MASSSLHAQYLPTVIEGNHWTIRKHLGMGGYIDYGYSIQCDTLINNKLYKEVKQDNQSLLGWVREDTTKQDVFFIKYGQSEENHIISYQVNEKDTFWLNGYPIICDSTSTIHIFDESRKIIYFNNFQAFIEGVGNSFYGIYDFGFYQTIEGFTPDSIFCEPMTGQFVPNCALELTVFPNPTSDYLEIRNPTDLASHYRITDQAGITMFLSEQIADPPLRIDTSNWPNGTYILFVNGQFARTIVKLH